MLPRGDSSMEKTEINPERRWLLRVAPVAAAAGWALVDSPLLATAAGAQTATTTEGAPFELISRHRIEDDVKAAHENPGNKTLYECKTFTMMMTYEAAKSWPEFEWHEGRDHIFHILEGATTYELGGTPQNAHSPKPGEWLAPASDGATTVELKSGDMLVVRRGTPHRRITKQSVTLVLIAPQTT